MAKCEQTETTNNVTDKCAENPNNRGLLNKVSLQDFQNFSNLSKINTASDFLPNFSINDNSLASSASTDGAGTSDAANPFNAIESTISNLEKELKIFDKELTNLFESGNTDFVSAPTGTGDNTTLPAATGTGDNTSLPVATGGDAIPNTPSTTNKAPTGINATGTGQIDGLTVGIDGHSDWTGTYANFTPQQTLDQVKAMGLGLYQTDLNVGDPSLTQQVIAAAKKDNVQILASIGADPKTFANAKDAYDQSFAMGAKFSSQFGDGVKLWQLGNENNDWAMSSPQNFQVAESEIKGLTDGLKSSDPGAETLINTTSGATGIQFLNQLKNDGVDWSVTGYHAYTQNGNVADSGQGGTSLADDAKLGKPIYINEFNGWTSSDYSKGPALLPGNPELITKSLDSIRGVAKQDNIIGANIYELLNTPEISGSEGSFGVLNADGSTTPTSDAITAYMKANSSA